ncbi:hypothetical protein ABBQ38_009271 [Trebouxia sp. C0009 RCD-2024]
MVHIPDRQLYIDGAWQKAAQGQSYDVYSPASGSKIGTIPSATAEDVDKAITAALKTYKSGVWSKRSGAYRAAFLRAMAGQVRERKAALAKLETTDMGKPIQEAEWDMDDVASCFEYYAELAEKLDKRQGQALQLPMEEFKGAIRREPLGVVGLITPWNYPMLLAAWKVAPALAAGNCCILKPSEVCSLTCLEMAAIAHDVGLPPGVFNVITGTGLDAGAPLSSDPRLAKIAFTGSVASGRKVNACAASNGVPTTMELGGKSALLVFDDADVEKAVEWCMFGVFWTNGQICSSTSRLLVQEGIADAFYKQLKRRAESIKQCDPLREDCRMGPVVSQDQLNKIMGFIKDAEKEGGKLLTGGKRPPGLDQGFYVQPTVFTGMTPGMRLWREEVFGPVLAAMTFKTEEEAIQLANDSEFGLAGAVISADEQRCARVAEALEVGIMWVNCSQPCFCQAPWGGNKASGHGRELGEWGLEAYLSVKQVTTYVSKDRWSWYPPSKL